MTLSEICVRIYAMEMIHREPINSKSIRQHNAQLYKEVFSRCQVVVSASDNFFWSGEFARFFGGMSIIQKLPTKNSVGLEVLNEQRIEFASELYGYLPRRSTFVTVKYDPTREIRLLKYLERVWPTLDKADKIKGFRIHIISESHCGGGLGTNGVINACLAAGLLLLSGKITPEEIERWQAASTNELLDNRNYENFRKTFCLAWKLSAATRNGNSSGATNFCALIKTQYPIVYLSENLNRQQNHSNTVTSETIPENYEYIDKAAFWGGRLEEMFPLNMPQPWTIDVGRLFSGTQIISENIFKSLYQLKVDFEALRKIISQEVITQIRNPILKERMLSESSNHLGGLFSYQEYLNIFNIITARMLLSLAKLFEVGPSEEAYREFFDVIIQAQDFNRFLRHSTPTIDIISAKLVKILASNNELGLAGVKMEDVGRGGHLLFACPSGNMPANLDEEVQHLAKETKRDITLDWASHIDGFGADGLSVEQFIVKDIYSSFLAEQSFRVTIWEGNQKRERVIDATELEDVSRNYDMVLLESTNKIYIGSVRLDSRSIVSAKGTIKILKKVLKQPNYHLTNKAFRETSYGQNRYDLQSKILAPLNKNLRKITQKEFQYKIRGGCTIIIQLL